MKNEDEIVVKCVCCGKIDTFSSRQFAISEDGKKSYRCSSCRESVVENRVQHDAVGGRQLLTED